MNSYASTEDLSDHFSILFNLDSGGESPPTPSKFNQVWLTKDDYQTLVEYQCVHIDTSSSSSFMCQFSESIARVKATMKHWLKSYKDRTQAQLKEAKDKIACFYKDNALGPLLNIQLD